MQANIFKKIHWDKFSIYLFTEKKLSRSKGSIQSYQSRYNILAKTFEDKPLNRDTFNEFIQKYQEASAKPTYMNGFIKMIKHLDRYLSLEFEEYKQQFIDYSYFKENKHPIIDTLTFEEMKLIANTNINYRLNSEVKNYKYRCLTLFLSQTGCRINEALTLKWNDLASDKLIFRETKTGDDRWVPISKTLGEQLQKLPHGCEYVFTNDTGKEKLDDTVAGENIKLRARTAGIQKKVYNHIFRHSFITEMLKSGCELVFVARIVGHSDYQTTARYSHFLLTDLENALYSHHPMIKGGQTFSMLKERIKAVIDKMVDADSYQILTDSSNESFTISVQAVSSVHN